LPEDKTTEIYLIPNNIIVYKINCKNQGSPCTINLKYLGDESEVEVFVSQTEEKPTLGDCDKRYEGQPKSIVVFEATK
jgi:hypothetical protein